jgi:hypothetical protein
MISSYKTLVNMTYDARAALSLKWFRMVINLLIGFGGNPRSNTYLLTFYQLYSVNCNG